MLVKRYNERKYNTTPNEYFVLTDDKTGKVISCAETSNHLRVSSSDISGKYLLVNEFNQNGNYIRPDIPMFAFLAKKAIVKGNSNIAIGTSDIDEKPLKNQDFHKLQTGNGICPKTNILI